MYSVLYVDDEPGLLELGKAFLEMSGVITVETALSADEALRRLKTTSFDCIISDYQMPVMDGIKFLKHLRQEKNTIPFILFTGRGREEVVIEAVDNGVDYYLQKGGDPRSQFVELEHKTLLAIEHRRTENELRESRQRMTGIIDHLPDATLAISLDGTVIAWNKAIEEMTGVPKEQILGTRDYSYSLPFYGTRRPLLINLVLHDEAGIASMYPAIQRKDHTLVCEMRAPGLYGGKGAYLWLTASPLYDTSGRIAGAIESMRDITGRKLAEEALRESEGRLSEINSAFLSFTPDPVRNINILTALAGRMLGGTCALYNRLEGGLLCSLGMWNTPPGFKSCDAPDGHICTDIIHEGKEDPSIIPDLQSSSYAETDPNVRQYQLHTYLGVPVKIGMRFLGSLCVVYQKSFSPGPQDLEILTFLAKAVSIEDERRTALQALHESEERYRAVIEDQTEFITRFLPDGTHVFVNEAYCRYFGLTSREIIGSKFTPNLFEEDKPQVQQHLRSLTPENPVGTMEHRIIMPDGKIRWQQWSDRAIYDKSENLIEFQSVGRDITDRKKAEDELREACVQITATEEELRKQYDEQQKSADALRESEEKYRTLAEASSDFIILVNRDGTVAFINRAGAAFIGMTPEEIIGRHSAELSTHDVVASHQQSIGHVFKEGKGSRVEIAIGHPDTLRWLDTLLVPMKDADGKTTAVLVVSREITEHKAAEAALRESEEQYRSLVNNLNVGVYRNTPEMPGRWLWANPAFLRIFGFPSLEEVQGRPVTESYENPDERQAFIDRIRAQGSVKDFILQMRRKDGTPIWVSVNAQVKRNPRGSIDWIDGICEDISEKRKADETLRASAEMYRTVLNNTGSATIIIEADMTLSFVNPEFERVMGYTKEEVEGKRSWPELIFADDLEPMIQYHRLRRLDPSKAPRNYEFRFITKGGQVRSAFITIALIPGTKKTVASFVDITERKQAEAALRESERNYRTIIENIQDAYYRSDRDGNIIMISPSVLRLTGYGEEKELLGKNIAETMYADPSERRVLLQALNRDGYVNNFEVVLKRRDGTTLIVETNSHKYYDENGDFLGVEGIFRDITARREAEKALETSEAMYRTIFENTGTATVLIEDTTIISLANAEFERLSGYSRKEIEGKKSWVEFVVMEDRDRMVVQHNRRRDRGEPALKHYEFRFIRKSGEIRKIFLTIDLIPGTRKSVASLMDITETIVAQESLKLTNKKLNLINSITRHDIANQLSTLTGFLELTKRKITDPELLRYLEKAGDAAAFIHEQIEFAKNYEALGTRDPLWQKVDAVISRASVPPQITLIVECGPAEILGDPMLPKVFYNLIDNSLRHGKTVTEIRVSCVQENNVLSLVYEDNGTGIPAGEKEIIFNREFGKNTGLGLFLAREILAITGLTIRENGTPGRGARFEIRAPEGAYRVEHPTSPQA